MFAGVDIFHKDRSASAANTRHFAQHLQRLLKMMQGQPADNNIECPILEGQILRVRGAEGNVGNVALLRALFGDREHGLREVHAHDFPRGTREGFRDVARARRDIQHALVPGEMSRGDQAPYTLFVCDPRISRKGLCLRRERFPNDVVVLRHAKSLAQASHRSRLRADS